MITLLRMSIFEKTKGFKNILISKQKILKMANQPIT